jgi:hypothetical protein
MKIKKGGKMVGDAWPRVLPSADPSETECPASREIERSSL